MKQNLEELVTRWRKDAEQYIRQVEEARRAGSSHEGMLNVALTLRRCALDLEQLLNDAKNPI